MEHTFNNLLVEAIDDVLSSLGEPVKNQLYIRLQEDFSVQKNQIPEQIFLFSEFLIRTFGPSAAFIQIRIMKSFNAKLTNKTANSLQPIALIDDLSFVSYIQEMRDNINFQTILP
jgi:hypothetical protein